MFGERESQMIPLIRCVKLHSREGVRRREREREKEKERKRDEGERERSTVCYVSQVFNDSHNRGCGVPTLISD